MIIFQSEYYGETVAHPLANLSDIAWLSFGRTRGAINLVVEAYKTMMNSNVRILQAPSDQMKMAKYMENAYVATKVVFCYEMYQVCKKLGLDYNQVSEIWIADSRIGTSHTFAYEDNFGYSGIGLPKDIALI
jgi:UDP-glucose 6-dehydrogenase